MPHTQSFSLATVLTITTGRLLCPIEDVYAILNHMTGDDLYTHQLPRVMDECRPWLIRWFPALPSEATAHLDTLIARDGPEEGCKAYVRFLRAFGLPEQYDVGQIPRDDHARRDPVAELVEMVGEERVIIVTPAPEEAP